MVNIGLQLYSIRSYMEEDFLGTLKRVKQAGFDSLEFAGFGGLPAAQLRDECQRLNLNPYAAHIPMEDLREKTDETLRYIKELGLRYAIIPYTPADTLENCKQTNTLLKKLVGPFSEVGIRVGYHNHSNEFEKFDGRYALEIIMDGVDGVYELDTAWVQVANIPIVPFIKQLGDRVGPIHAKDVNADYQTRDSHDINVGIGEGVIDFAGVISALRELGTLSRGIIVEQEAYTTDPFESLTASVRALRRLVGE